MFSTYFATVQPRRHGGALVGLAPPNNTPNPPNWNVKRYK